MYEGSVTVTTNRVIGEGKKIVLAVSLTNAAAGGSYRNMIVVTKVTAAMMKRCWCEAGV